MLLVAQPGRPPNNTSSGQLLAIGLLAGLPDALQTRPQAAQVAPGQWTKQGEVARLLQALAGHGLDAGPGWPRLCFQTRPSCTAGVWLDH